MNPTNCYKLYSYNDAVAHSKIVNTHQIDYYMWIELPHCISTYWNLDDITECSATSSKDPIVFAGKVIREPNRPWLRVETSLLNMSAGLHMYKFSFIDEITKDTTSLYIAYHIQDDSPDTSSYVYMKRDEV